MLKSIEQIKQEIKAKEKELAAAIKAAKAEGVAAVKELVVRHQLTYSDVKHLFKDAGAKRSRRALEPRYRLSTADGVVEWAGVGRQPRAITQYLKSGGKLEDITI